MWPRRSPAPLARPNASASSSSSTSRAAPAAHPQRPLAASKEEDCGWLLRAVANKKKKKKQKTTPAAASVGWTNLGNRNGDNGAPKISKKRQLESKEECTAKLAFSAKLPRGIGWSQPSTKVSAVTTTNETRSALDLPTAPPGESFEEVFAEIYGASKPARPTVDLDDDVAPSLPLSATLFLPDHDSPSNRSAQPKLVPPKPTLQAPISRESLTSTPSSNDAKWGFAAPSAIELDAFNTPTQTPHTSDQNKKRLDEAQFTRWKDEQSSHAVGDNFVRLNMRKRFKGSSGKAKKQPAYLRSSGFVDAEERARTQQTNDSKADVAHTDGGGGLLDDGIDFIEECLEVLNQHEARRQDLATQGESADPSESPSLEPPRCQHALVSQRILVKKKNKNHGRAFFACPLGYDEGRCDYFLWEENHTQFALHRLLGTASNENGDDAGVSTFEDEPTSNYIPLDLSKPIAKQAKAILTNLRVVFGHADFRPGQRWAIERVFSKERTLLVLPTGAGKSLCYQYPALFLPGITIVISPLISLMNDQFHNLPPVLKRQATCVATSSSSKTQYAEFVRDLLGGKLKLLFVSPEKALTSGFQRLLRQMQSRISLVCVDEAHCISEWSHHFRPSYLRLASIFALADSVLAITATASRRVEKDILSQLSTTPVEQSVLRDDDDASQQSVMRMPWQRENLHLRAVRVSSDEERLERLCDVLTKTAVSGAVIMYVHQQWQAEAMANLLQERLALDGGDSSKTKWTKHKIAAYHAKMDPEVKEKVRLGFLSGRVKLVIATIAFGMGIDKQNVRLVIHYHVPSSIEHYLQQVGRAGRDGRAASALLFLLDDDVRAFRSLLFSNALHISQVRKLVELVTGACEDSCNRDFMRQHVAIIPYLEGTQLRSSRVWMDVASLEQHLDMKSAMVETFLTLMSLHPSIQEKLRLHIHPTAMSWCVISMMEKDLTSPQTDPLLKRLVASVMDNDASSSLGHVEVDVDGYLRHLRVHFHVASAARALLPVENANRFGEMESQMIDVQSRRLMQNVRTWQSSGLIRKFRMERSAFDVQIEWVEPFETDMANEREKRRHNVETWVKLLYDRHEALEKMEIKRLRQLYSALSAAVLPTTSSASSLLDIDSKSVDEDSCQPDGSHILEEKLCRYFDEARDIGDKDEDEDDQASEWRALTSPLTADLVEAIERDVEVLTSRSAGAVVEGGDNQGDNPAHTTSDNGAPSAEWHSYNVARIFHGLASPCFPSKQWRDQLWWRKYNHVAFEKLVMIADKVLAGDQRTIDQ